MADSGFAEETDISVVKAARSIPVSSSRGGNIYNIKKLVGDKE